MTTNMSPIDRMLRGFLVMPIALVLAWIIGFTTVAGIVLTVFAVILGVTALAGFCPTYALFGFSTNRKPAS